MDEHVECSHWSWLGNFTQWFSSWPPFARALEFLNIYFLPRVSSILKKFNWKISGLMAHCWNSQSLPEKQHKIWNMFKIEIFLKSTQSTQCHNNDILILLGMTYVFKTNNLSYFISEQKYMSCHLTFVTT